MKRGELLDFYHSQFRAAAENRYLADDEARRLVHLVLAEHFRRAADPEGRDEWDGNSTRGLRELPFHTAGSDDQAEVVALLTSLPYLSARVATGNVYQLAEDYALTAGPAEFVEWRDFIAQHSQRLTNHPKMLVALVQHEGFRSARLQVLSRTWRYPWLRTWEEPAPPGRPEPTGLHLEIKADKRFAHGRVSAVAWQARLIFSVERLGSIAIMDYRDMQELLTRVSIGSGRPVKIACAPDASSLMVILEPGIAELYRCTLGADGRPLAFELAARLSCCLPEIDDPVVEWHEDAYWMQIRPGMLARVDAVTTVIREEPLCGSAPGELGALIFFEGGRTFAAVRQGHSTILGGANGVSVRYVGSDMCTACSCGDRAAAFFADGSAVVFDATETHAEMATIQSGIVRGAAGWDGDRLLWLKESPDFAKLYVWHPTKARPNWLREVRRCSRPNCTLPLARGATTAREARWFSRRIAWCDFTPQKAGRCARGDLRGCSEVLPGAPCERKTKHNGCGTARPGGRYAWGLTFRAGCTARWTAADGSTRHEWTALG
jgi:hypothetical protein